MYHQCRLCPSSFERKVRLRNHIEKEHLKLKIECYVKKCRSITTSREYFQSHLREGHRFANVASIEEANEAVQAAYKKCITKDVVLLKFLEEVMDDVVDEDWDDDDKG